MLPFIGNAQKLERFRAANSRPYGSNATCLEIYKHQFVEWLRKADKHIQDSIERASLFPSQGYDGRAACTLRETEHPGHLNVRGVLRHCVPSKGRYPLHLYLPQILMGEHIHFEVNQDKAFQNIVIEYRVNIEICLSG